MSTLIKNNNKWLKVAGSGVPPVDVVEEDNMNPVTSNAVAKALSDNKKYMTVPDWANAVKVVSNGIVSTAYPNFDTIYTATEPCFITMEAFPYYDAYGRLRISGKSELLMCAADSNWQRFTFTGILNAGDTLEVCMSNDPDASPTTNINVYAMPLKLVEV